MDSHPPTNLARTAYEAYVADAGGVSLATGAPLPAWDALSPAIQSAWLAAAVAVVARMFAGVRAGMVAAGHALAESNQELKEACTYPRTGTWDQDYPMERETYDRRHTAAQSLLDAVAALDAVLVEIQA